MGLFLGLRTLGVLIFGIFLHQCRQAEPKISGMRKQTTVSMQECISIIDWVINY